MAVTFKPQPPAQGGPRKGGARPASAGVSRSTPDILTKVTRNIIVNAVVRNKQLLKAKAERTGTAKKRRTRQEILNSMDLQELQVERLAMSRMGFSEKVKDIDDRIETERERLKQEREAKDANIMQQKVGGLEMAHRRRIMALETRLAEEMKGLRARQLQELEDSNCYVVAHQAKAKHKREYDMLIAETATRATGGISSCICKNEYLCRHNKSASYNTRKPTKDVIRLRQNAQRLRSSGRQEEAEEMENKAADIERSAETRWRERVESAIVSSAWAGGKSRLEQMVERQQNTVATLEESHIEKSALTKKNHEILRRNLLFTLGAEKKKCSTLCACRRSE
eukprot:10527-Heterococcus_DN1.PRE.1